jgi:NhaP-type Na+/H+ or K+/H+ antiporter
VAQYLALAIFTVGVVHTLGSDDLLAAFAAGEFRCLSYSVWAIVTLLLPGSAVSWDQDFNQRIEGEAFASVVELLLNCGCFFYIGAWLPWGHFTLPDLGISPWKLIVLCIGILFLRRIPVLLALYKWIPEITNWREALFCGHFGKKSLQLFGMTSSYLFIHRTCK